MLVTVVLVVDDELFVEEGTAAGADTTCAGGTESPVVELESGDRLCLGPVSVEILDEVEEEDEEDAAPPPPAPFSPLTDDPTLEGARGSVGGLSLRKTMQITAYPTASAPGRYSRAVHPYVRAA